MTDAHAKLIKHIVLFCLPVFLAAGEVRANGWEHGAVPFESLVNGLSFDDTETRAKAAQSLGFRGQPEGVDVLLDRLSVPEPSYRVRAEIYHALGSLESIRALPVLYACFDTEPREEVQANCADALGHIGSPESISRLKEIVDHDPSLLVRAAALDSLGHFDTPETQETLERFLNGDNPLLRRHAAQAMGQSGAQGAVAPLMAAFTRTHLPDEKQLIVRALGQLANPEAAGFLEQIVREMPAGPLKLDAIGALAATRAGSVVDALIDALDDPDPSVQAAAILGLREQGDEVAVEPVARLAGRVMSQLTETGDMALVHSYGRSVIDISLMVEALRTITNLDPGAGTAVMLQASLARPLSLISPEALSLADGIYQMRRLALYGLGYTASPLAEARCGEVLNDPDPRIRMVAVRCLGMLEARGSGNDILARLGDPAAEVRWTAAEVLGLLRLKDAGGPLQTALSDSNPFVRRNAAQALGYLGRESAREDLKLLRDADPDIRVRKAAGLALESLP